MGDYDQIEVTRKSGQEEFTIDECPIGVQLLHFWQWMGSDLTGNAFRGILAEYIVAQALGIADGTRDEWSPFDLVTQKGTRVEVKSAAYLQSWRQERPSRIQFNIKAARSWDAATNILSSDSQRRSDVYVFCLLNHRDQSTLNPLRLEQWEFYVLPASVLNERVPNQRTISLGSLMTLNPKRSTFATLRQVLSDLYP